MTGFRENTSRIKDTGGTGRDGQESRRRGYNPLRDGTQSQGSSADARPQTDNRALTQLQNYAWWGQSNLLPSPEQAYREPYEHPHTEARPQRLYSPEVRSHQHPTYAHDAETVATLLSISGQYGQGDASSIYSTPQVYGVIEQPEAQNIQEVQRDQRGDQHHNSPDLSEGEKKEYGFWDPSRGPLNREASHPTDQPLPTADAEASTPKPFTREQLEDQEFAKYVKDIKELRQLAEDYRRQDDYRRQRYSSLRSRETQALPLAREAFKDNVAGTSIPRDTGAEASSSQDAGSVVDEKELEKGLNIALLIPEEHLNQLALRLTRDKAARGAANLIKLFRGLENRAQAISQMSKSLTGGREITQTMVSEAALLLRNALNKTSFKHSDIIKAKSVIDTLYETGKLPAASSSSEQASTSANPEPTQ